MRRNVALYVHCRSWILNFVSIFLDSDSFGKKTIVRQIIWNSSGRSGTLRWFCINYLLYCGLDVVENINREIYFFDFLKIWHLTQLSVISSNLYENTILIHQSLWKLKRNGRNTSISSSRKHGIISKRNSLLEEYESKILPSLQTQFKYFRKLSKCSYFPSH